MSARAGRPAARLSKHFSNTAFPWRTLALLISITIGVVFAASVYLMLSRELKALAMGVFLVSHAANLAIIAVSRSPLDRRAPVLGPHGEILGREADPLPQALILTAIVIGFALQAFLLSMLVVTWRRTRTLELDELRLEERAAAPRFADFDDIPEGYVQMPETDTGPEEVDIQPDEPVGASAEPGRYRD